MKRAAWPVFDYPKTTPPMIETYRVYMRGLAGLVFMGTACGRSKAEAYEDAMNRLKADPWLEASDLMLTTTDGPILPANWKKKD